MPGYGCIWDLGLGVAFPAENFPARRFHSQLQIALKFPRLKVRKPEGTAGCAASNLNSAAFGKRHLCHSQNRLFKRLMPPKSPLVSQLGACALTGPEHQSLTRANPSILQLHMAAFIMRARVQSISIVQISSRLRLSIMPVHMICSAAAVGAKPLGVQQ